MGHLIRSHNWEQTPIGSPGSWPQSLRTALSIIINSRFPMFLFWGEQLLCFYNDAYRPSLGNNGKHPDGLGKPGSEIWPEIWDVIKPLIDQVLSGGEATWSEDQLIPIYRNSRLEDVYWTFSYSPVCDESGKPAGVFVTCAETTNQVLTRKRVERNEARFRSLIEQAPVATGLFVGRDMVIEVANKPMFELWGKGDSVLGKPLAEALPELIDQPFLQILDDIYTTGQTYYAAQDRCDLVVDGKLRTFYFNFTYKPLLDEQGQVYAIMDMAVDVTQQVMAQQQIEESRRKLLASFEQSPVAIAIIDEFELTFRTANPFYGKLVGRSPDELIGKPLLEALPELRGQGFDQLLKNVIDTGIPFIALEVSVDMVRNNQLETIYVDLTYQPQYEADSSITGVLVVATDVTQQVRARQKIEESEASYRTLSAELEQQVTLRTAELAATNEELASNNEGYAAINEELEEANGLLIRSNQNLQQFAYVASHDLQEPLRKIQQFGDLLKTRYTTQLGDGIDYLDRMQSAAGRMAALIRDLLSFSRISTQRDTSASRILTQVVKTVVSDLELLIEETGAVVTIESLPKVLGDASQLGQLFQNLLSNALKFRRADTPPHIEVRAQIVAAKDLPPSVQPARTARIYHRIDVSDNGIGFDEKYVDRIFQVFQRLHGKNEFAGTGVGLAICEKVATNHGGVITASSQPGKGATFSVYLPI